MYVPPAPVLISRMRQKERTGSVTGAGIPADSDFSLFILPGIIRVKFRARDGDSGLCINFPICPKGMNRLDALVVDAVHVAAL